MSFSHPAADLGGDRPRLRARLAVAIAAQHAQLVAETRRIEVEDLWAGGDEHPALSAARRRLARLTARRRELERGEGQRPRATALVEGWARPAARPS